jgi:hypothetical protein
MGSLLAALEAREAAARARVEALRAERTGWPSGWPPSRRCWGGLRSPGRP